jgi:putative ABC transport system permease protein
MVGTTPDWFTMVRREMLAGRKLTQRDEEENSGVVVLTEYGARRLMAARSTVGSDIRLNGQYFRVVGIVRSEGNLGAAIQTPDEDVDAYVPLSSARERFGDIFSKRSSGTFIRERVELHQLIIEVDETGNVEKVAAGLERALSTTHTDADYRISVPLTLLRQAEATKRTFNIVLGAIAGISLLVGGVGIMNIMLASVTERTREIGVRRAIGAKRRQIVGQFLVETVVLSTLGGAVGLGLGLLLPWAVTRIAGMPTVITWWSLILSLGISMTVGMVFGIYPAVRAANLDPIMALRHE